MSKSTHVHAFGEHERSSPSSGHADREELRWPSLLWEGMARTLPWSADAAARMLDRALRHHPSPGFAIRLRDSASRFGFAIRLWDGRELEFGEDFRFTIAFRDAATLRACLGGRDPARLAEAYVANRVSIEGDIAAAIELAYFLRGSAPDARADEPRPRAWLRSLRHGGASSCGVARDARDARAHYELSDEFFRLFLDERMVYSCAYFARPGQPLEEAQMRKLDLVCRKLRLSAGDRFLDIGCGWGALVVWAAMRYGVRATGITLSERQAAHARRCAEQRGVSDQVTIQVRHYAELAGEVFDKVSSVGMYEHVGRAKLAAYLVAVRPRCGRAACS